MIFGLSVRRDYEAIKKLRRQVLADKENLEALVERGDKVLFCKRYMWRVDGVLYPYAFT